MRAAKNPASLHTRQPGINQRRLSLSVSAALDRACVRTVGIGTTHLRAGCRGFIGPVPLPLVIRGYYFCIRYATTNQAVRQGLLHLFCTFFGKNHDKNVRSLAFAAEIRYTIQAVAMTTGSCAICRCEPCQGREAAAISAGRMCCGVAQSERRYLLLEYRQAAWESAACFFYRRGIVKWWMANKAKKTPRNYCFCAVCVLY